MRASGGRSAVLDAVHDRDGEHARKSGGKPNTRDKLRNEILAAHGIDPAMAQEERTRARLQKRWKGASGLSRESSRKLELASAECGTPVDDRVRRKVEEKTGADLSGVRIHTSGASHEAANSVGAVAYTAGEDIHFSSGAYKPESPEGERILVHELVHTIQQRQDAEKDVAPRMDVSEPRDAGEREAEDIAHAVVEGDAPDGTAAKMAQQKGTVDGPASLPGAQNRATPASARGAGGGAPVAASKMETRPQRNGSLERFSVRQSATAAVQRFTSGSGSGKSESHSDSGPPNRSKKGTKAAKVPVGHPMVQLTAHRIGGLGLVPVYHLYIVHTDNSGGQTYYRGGPDGPVPAGGKDRGYGAIQCAHGTYSPGTIDYVEPNSKSTTVATGPAVLPLPGAFAAQCARIDATHTPYWPTGPNSNSVAFTLLNRTGLSTAHKPVTWTPGWGTLL
jgi:hypothetical protein